MVKDFNLSKTTCHNLLNNHDRGRTKSLQLQQKLPPVPAANRMNYTEDGEIIGLN